MKYRLKLLLVAFLLISFSKIKSQSRDVEHLKNKIDSLASSVIKDFRISYFKYSLLNKNNKLYLKGATDNKILFDRLKNALTGSNADIAGFELLPSEKLNGRIYGLVNLSVINIRSKPRHSAELVSQALLGTPVKVLTKNNDWYLIQTPDKYIGWTDAAAVVLLTQKEYLQWSNSAKLIFKNIYGFVTENPVSTAPHVSDLVMGDLLLNIGEKENYFKIKFPDGRVGYVPKDDCVDFNKWFGQRVFNVAELLNRAEEFVGVPYLWGGTSVKGFDCSGFTKTIFYMSGLILPRDASQQVNVGVEVDTSNNFSKLQPGDLLFFGRKATEKSPEKVVHVGIYIGGLKFIHASGKVKINSLDRKSPLFNEYRYKTFLHARRILSSINKNGVFQVIKNKFYSGRLQ